MMAEAGEARLMHGDHTLSPVDIGARIADGRPLRWPTTIIAIAASFLFLTNAATIDGWAKELPPGPVAERVTTLSGRWLAITDAVGLGAPRAAVHRLWKQAEAARF